MIKTIFMKNVKILKTQVLIFLLSWFASVSYASSFYAEDFKIPAGGSVDLDFMLDNDQDFVGFQFDLVLPEGLDIVSSGDGVECSLSSRTDGSYSLFSNVLADGSVRIGAFSTQNTPMQGNSGKLLSVRLVSSDTFVEGVLQIKNIRFVDKNNKDVILPDVDVDVTRERVLVEQIVLSQTTLSLPEGETAMLSVNVLPEDASTKDVIWKSSNEDVAVVSETGEVKAVKAGSAAITCTAVDGSGASAACWVWVTAVPVSSISIVPSGLSLKVSGTAQLVVSVLPENASNKELMWSSSNASVATVDASGKVMALSTGEAIIIATAGDGSGVSATCVVTVGATQAESVSITAEGPTTLKAGGTVQLRATVTPETATDKSVTWRSSDDKIATVNTDGLVTAVGVGMVTITCTNSAGQTATVEITVEPTPVSSITLNHTTATLKISGTLQLEATVQPDNATDKGVNWSSSNSDIATVTTDGLVTALAPGEAIITADAADGLGVSATCVVTVKNYDFFVGGLYYAITSEADKTVMVTYKNKHDYSGDIVIPSTVQWNGTEYRVTSVGKYAFMGCDIVSVVIPGSVGRIGDNAFSSSSLQTVVLEEGITTIGYQAFAWCDELKQVKLPSSVRTLEYGAFAISGLTEIDIPSGMDDIGEFAFYDCRQLRKARVSSTVRYIRDKAFLQCSALETFDLYNGIAKIGKCAFGGWESMKEFYCASRPIAIEDSVFLSPMDIQNIDFSTCVLYVPKEYVQDYREALVWSKFANIWVEGRVGSISLDKETLDLHVGDNVVLNATVLPDNAENKDIVWSSSDETVSTVTAEGFVTAQSLGEAIITVTAADGSGVSASCVVTVEPMMVSSVSLSETSAKLNKGENLTLTATVKPDDATDKSVKWTSSDEAVATVSGNGVVTATGAGTAEITATANDGSGQSATCVVTVEETVVIKWNQEFEVVAGDAVRLNAEASDGAQVAFRAVKPNGGYVIPEITNDNGVWTATFANIGAVILEAYVEGLDENVECEPVRKTFNVLPDRDVMFIDGIYYRYTDNTKTALSVTYGYRQYEGDVVVPSVAGGLPVVSVGNRAFYSNAGLTSVTLPEGLERIESDQAFGNCRQLADVVLPSTVTYIGGWTFNSDNGLQEIHCGMEHPLDIEVVINGDEDIFNGFVDYDSCVLYVPYGSADEYREAEVWKNFKNIVEEQREPVLAVLLSLDVNDLRLNVGETAVLKPVIYPSSAENQLVTWTSSDETVATVDAYGEVLAVGAGSAVITAATNDGSGLTAQCVVTVELPSGIDAVGCDGVRIVTENGRIVVTGLSADDEISVTTIGGALVYKGANVAVNVPRTGIYIVGIKGRFYKVAVR